MIYDHEAVRWPPYSHMPSPPPCTAGGGAGSCPRLAFSEVSFCPYHPLSPSVSVHQRLWPQSGGSFLRPGPPSCAPAGEGRLSLLVARSRLHPELVTGCGPPTSQTGCPASLGAPALWDLCDRSLLPLHALRAPLTHQAPVGPPSVLPCRPRVCGDPDPGNWLWGRKCVLRSWREVSKKG